MNDELFDYLLSFGANVLCGVGGIALGVWIMKVPMRPKPARELLIEDQDSLDEARHALHVALCYVNDREGGKPDSAVDRATLVEQANRALLLLRGMK